MEVSGGEKIHSDTKDDTLTSNPKMVQAGFAAVDLQKSNCLIGFSIPGHRTKSFLNSGAMKTTRKICLATIYSTLF